MEPRTIPQKVGLIFVILFILSLASGGAAFGALYAQTPPLDTDNFNYIENARIMDVNGNFYQDLQGAERREIVSIDTIPDHVQNAFVAIEDQRFRSHHGVDYKRFGRGGVILLGGDPGIGKSTILLQTTENLGSQGLKILYISGEESEQQLKMRAVRMNVKSQNIFFLSEINVPYIVDTILNEKPDLVIIDSIQTMYSPTITSAPAVL